jgi:hypothetical protein
MDVRLLILLITAQLTVFVDENESQIIENSQTI